MYHCYCTFVVEVTGYVLPSLTHLPDEKYIETVYSKQQSKKPINTAFLLTFTSISLTMKKRSLLVVYLFITAVTCPVLPHNIAKCG